MNKDMKKIFIYINVVNYLKFENYTGNYKGCQCYFFLFEFAIEFLADR